MTMLQQIESRIYEIRGQRVMLDFHLAEMYATETKYLKRAVKNNIIRFPADFMFELTTEEWAFLRCNFCTLENGRGKHPKYLPMAFTELGVSMLSSVLKTDIAIEVNISIMRAFVMVRQLVLKQPAQASLESIADRMNQLEECLNDILSDQNEINEDNRMQLELINRTLAKMQSKGSSQNSPRKRIGYEGGEIK